MITRASLLLILLSAFVAPLPAQNIPSSCGPGDWFQLRASADRGEVSLLCKGAADAAFERPAIALRELQRVIHRNPHSADSFDAHAALLSMYFREGQYRKALQQLDLALAEKPDVEDLKAFRPMVASLAVDMDQKTISRRPAVIHSETIDDNPFAPVTINGVSATYLLDTGANFSVLCESEVKRLGLSLHENAITLSDGGGLPSAARVAVASDLWIGGVHLRHVVFAVAQDASEPFVDLPAGHKGILGIPVLLAVQSLRIEKENLIAIGADSAPSDHGMPLAFDNAWPVVQIPIDGKPLTFFLDTGAANTRLYKPFADAFPERMKQGKTETYKIGGVSGSSMQESIKLPSITFPFAHGVELAPATVLVSTPTDASRWAAGNLGFNMLVKALPVTIDFRSMKLSFDAR